MLAVGPQLIGINPNNGEILEDGQIRHLAPQELIFRFDEHQVIDAASLSGIQISRSGMDGVFGNGNDVLIMPGWVGIGEQPSEVVVRFAGALPDDVYRVTVFGTGPTPLTNVDGDAFNDGVDESLDFELDLGAQIVAVVPQPTGRDAGGARTQASDQIVVYFNDDDLHPTAVTTGQLATDPTVVDPDFYQLIFTNGTVTNTDDEAFTPTQVSYDPVTDSAVLTFASDLSALPTGPGIYRLRIGTDEGLPQPPSTILVTEEPGDSFDTAYDLGALGPQSQIIPSVTDPGFIPAAIDPEFFPIEFPGANDEPGHRDVPVQDHYIFGPDGSAGIETLYYNFRSDYGFDPLGNELYNAITPAQKDLARDIFGIYGSYLGIQVVESATQGLIIVTGDLRALDPTIDTGPGGVAGLAGGGIAIMDNAETWNDDFGGNWFSVAFHEIGHLLGLGHTYELAQMTIMGDDPILTLGAGPEPVFPGDNDILHGQYLHRPEGNDVDLYTFTVDQEGVFSAETFAERLADSSTLDTVISLYRNVGNDYELIARNDDYFSEDSFIEVDLTPGTYAIGVSASGNRGFDPGVEETGLYGTSDGPYDLRLTFRPLEESVIVDATGTALDGDGDGIPGGVYNFWFDAQTAAHTKFVDKSAIGGSGADGSLAKPYRTLTEAFAAAQFGDVVRVMANGGTDGDVNTAGDNLAFQVGFNSLHRPLEDGATVKVPRGVTLMIDAGVVFKSQDGAIEVGSSTPGIDRSGAALQVLGTPYLPVFFTSYNDETIGTDTNPSVPQTPAPGDWGGIIFRNDLDRASPSRVDYEARGIFLNYVNHADMRYGGGLVNVGSDDQVVSPIQMVDARPTITYNSISYSADAALAANPDSFEETHFHAPRYQTVPFTTDYYRIGPEIHGNALSDNTINGLFIRISTPAGDSLEALTVAGRFDDTDVVHVLKEDLVIQGTPGGPVLNEKTGQLAASYDARLLIDPGTVVKLGGVHIQVDLGAQLIAEGVDGNRVVFTSLADDTFGAGGNFDTRSDGDASSPGAGDWGGIYFGHVSTGSIDHALIRYGGGITRLESEFAGFNAIEIHQADVRITNSVLEYNAGGTGGQAPGDRFGLLSHEAATIFVRGAQPVIVGNIIRHNAGPAISINANSLNSSLVTDFGRSTGSADLIQQHAENQGPLVADNRLLDNSVNGMVVRGGTLTTESVWDDTSITHVLLDTIIVPDFHSSGGLRLESSPNESLVVKLSGSSAGFTAEGRPLDIDDRIGGMVHIIGQPGSPVVLTSLADDTVGAGVLPDGTPNTDTNNDGSASEPNPGDWRSILIDQYSNDRNVAVHTEWESPKLDAPGNNSTPDEAEFLGALASSEKGGDDNLRLGFEVLGFLSAPSDVDVFSFQASAGTEVWLDIDATSQALDTVIELVDRDGTVIARSDNSLNEAADPTLLTGDVFLMQKLPPYGGRDYFGVNPKDAGMRVVLPDAVGTGGVYHVRVRSSSDDLDDLAGGKTSGVYQLQIRLRETDELAGSNVRYADIRYATNGIEVNGQPGHSPLLGEAAEDGTANDQQSDAQDIGNLMESDLAAISVAGVLDASETDIDFYRFEVIYAALQGATGDMSSDAPAYVGTVFDVDYSDGLARGNITLSIFDSQGRLILTAGDSQIVDDTPAHEDGDLDDLSRGSGGALDSFLGTVELPQGTYFVAVSAASRMAQELEQFIQRNPTNPLVRLEPVNSTVRIAEDHIGYSGGSTAADPIVPTLVDEGNVVPYFLGDVVLFVSQDTNIRTDESLLVQVNPFTGAVEVYGDPDRDRYLRDVGDLAMRYDSRQGGNLYAFTLDIEDGEPQDGTSGNLILLNTGNGSFSTVGDDGIVTYELDPADPANIIVRDTGVQFEAMTFGTVSGQEWLLAIGFRADMYETPPPAGEPHAPNGVTITQNILYRFNPATGQVWANDDANEPRVAGAGTDAIERGEILTSAVIQAVDATRIANNVTFSDIYDGLTFSIDDGSGITAFEFDAGPEAIVDFNLNQNERIEDGEFFVLDGQTFEFDTGIVINITGRGNAFTDGATLTVQDIQSRSRTFEFDNDGNSSGIALTFDANTNATQMADVIVAAINNETGATYSAQASNYGGRISVTSDQMIDIGPTATGVELLGNYGVTDPLDPLYTAVAVEENFTPQQVRNAVVAAVNAANLPTTSDGVAATVRAATSGTRVNFSGATTADFSGVNDFADMGSVGGTSDPEVISVPFLVSDNAVTIARRIRDIINSTLGPAVTATVNGLSVEIVGVADTPVVDAPLRVAGEGPGGIITGMAILDGQVYAVSDNGGLWQIYNPLSTSPTVDYIATSEADLRGIEFAGLTVGPSDVEGGSYADLLFGISRDGTVYAFDTDGVLQPIFLDGATSVETGLWSVQGLAFSSLDENLWHTTGRRDTNAGHGVIQPYDFSRANVNGGSSFYFGRDYTNPNLADYNTPGGAHGTIVTNPFDLSDYSAEDQPYLYFNYLVQDENTDYNPNPFTPMRDSFRVYLSAGDTGDWYLLATNDSFRSGTALDEYDDIDPFDGIVVGVQELYDNTGTWRQVRVSLESFAGMSDLQLRFEYATAGSMNVGDEMTTGSELQALPGSELRDGDTFTIDATTFEFDSGFTVVLPGGSAISDGDTVTVTGATSTTIFEFDNDGVVANTAIGFSSDEPAADIAARFQAAVLNNGPFDVDPKFNVHRVNLVGAVDVAVTTGSGVFVEGEPGVLVGVRVEIHEEMTSEEVAEAMAHPMAVAFAGFDQQIVVEDGTAFTDGQIITVSDGTDVLTIEFDSGYTLRTPGGFWLDDLQTFTISNAVAGTNATFEFDKDFTNDGTNIIIDIDDGTSARDVGMLIANAITNAGLGLTARHLGNGVVHVGGTADDVLVNNSNLTVSGQAGAQTAGATALAFVPDSTFSADQMATALAQVINDSGLDVTATTTGRRVNLLGANVSIDTGLTGLSIVGAPTDTIKLYGDVVKVIGHTVWDEGKLNLTDTLYGDQFGAFNSELRGQANGYEGIYIDDLIIGFAERGEIVTGSTQNTDFRNNPQLPDNQILRGAYQFEIRRAADYGIAVPPDSSGVTLILIESFDTNDRLTQVVSLVAPSGAEIADGQTFTLGDGLDEVTFVFEDTGGTAVLPENGDVLSSAVDTGLTAGSGDSYSARAEVDDNSDVDFFAFDLNAGDTISIDIDAEILDSPLDSVLRLFDDSGNQLTYSDDDTAPGETWSHDSYIEEYTTLTAGRYYVGVSGYSNFSYDPFVAESGFGFYTGEYRIEFLLNGGQVAADATTIYFSVDDTAADIANLMVGAINSDTVQAILDVVAESNFNSARIELSGSVAVGAGLAAALSEPNDTLADAVDSGIVPAGAGAYRSRGRIGDNGSLAPGRDVDLIRLELSAGDTITIDIDSRDLGFSLDSIVRLFDAAGQELDYNDDYGGSLDSYLQYTVAADGVYYVGVSSFSNFSYNPNVAGSGTGYSTGFYQIEIARGAATAAGIGAIFHDNVGDTNRFRAQGQLLIESNFITYSEEFGIVVDAGQRSAGSDRPHQGPVRVLSNLNDGRLAPGVTIVNNVIAYSNTGGIHFSGDPNTAGGQVAPIPYGRILNNTIFGGVIVETPSLPPVSFVAPGSAVLMFGSDTDGTDVPPPGVVPNDDLSSAIQDFGFTFEFYGNDFTQFYINNNGNISFEEPLQDFMPSGFPYVDFTGEGIPIVAPFWADVDTRPYPDGSPAGSVHLATGTSAAGNPFVQIDWVDVGYYDTTIAAIDPNLGYRNNFTLYIEDDPTGDIVAFGYGNMEWTTGEVDSPLNDGFGGQGAQIGFDAGDGVHYASIARPNSQADLNSLMNNNNGQIVIGMDPTTGEPIVYGTGAGIVVDENASPTILNNILAGLDVGLDVDGTSQGTVLGGLLFQDNNTNSTGGLGDHAIVLNSGDPLFVDPDARNFYLDAGSQAIDSAVKSLQDRPSLVQVRQPLGINNSPILAPETDVFGLFRADDRNVDTPTGLGETVFIDRGAIDRIDFDGPLAALIVPSDGDGDSFVQVNEVLREFIIQLNDGGAGVADNTVSGGKVVVERNGTLLVQGVDYSFRYDETNDQIRLIAGAGVWTRGTYRIVLDNSDTTGIKDIANNALQANQLTGIVEFTIELGGGLDYGDAPDPTYPTLRPAGAGHVLVDGFYLGFGVDADSNGQPSALADADAFDDGVTFDTPVFLVGQSRVTVRASAPGRLDAWIDYNRNGVWEAGEKIFDSEPLVAGLNVLTYSVPGGVVAAAGESFARFRFSSAGGLAPGGVASDGEVEDYRVEIKQATWQNPNNPLDVNGDGWVSSQDALVLANFLYFNGQRQVPPGPDDHLFPVAPPPFYDVNGDDWVTPADALLVVLALRNGATPAPSGQYASAGTTSPSLGATETVAPSVVPVGSSSVEDVIALPVVSVAATVPAIAAPATEQVAPSADQIAAAFFAEEAARDLEGEPAAAFAVAERPLTERTAPSGDNAAPASTVVDQIMGEASEAEKTDFTGTDLIGDGLPTASAVSVGETVDVVFAEFDVSQELARLSAMRIATGTAL